jgi:1,4-dihydroxy-2-naphthoate octaprenyltransferase
MSFGDKARIWAKAVRAYSFPASIVPIVVGSVYAWYERGRFDGVVFALALVAGMAYHTATNLINDYYDYRQGVDRPGTLGGSGVLVERELPARQVLLAGWAALVVGTAIGLWFVLLYGWPILAIGAAGALGAVFYTTTPGSAKYNALGEPLVFVMMGVGMVVGAYYVQTGALSWNAVWVSLPVAFLVTAILQGNDTRDIVDDRAAGITTLAIALGPTGARAVYSLLLLGAYLSAAVLPFAGVAPWWVLLVLLTLPLAWRLHATYWTHRDVDGQGLVGTVERTAQLHLAFGLLLASGVALGVWFPL